MALLHRYQSIIHGNLKKAIPIYGVITAVALILSVILRYLLTYPIETPVSWTDNVVMAICMIGFTLIYRSRLPEKRITFKEIFLLTVGIGCVAAIFYGLYLWHYSAQFDTEFPQRYLEAESAKYNADEPGYNSAIEQLKYMARPKYLALMGAVYTVVTSFIIGFFVALVLKTEKSPIYKKK